MTRFEPLDDIVVILHQRGLYRQVSAYQRGQRFYAKHRGGFIRLYANGATSLPYISWESHEIDNVTVDNLGRLTTSYK